MSTPKGVIVSLVTASGDKHLGKFTVDDHTGLPVFFADLRDNYRDVRRGGYSINYALWLASREPPYDIRAFFFWDRDHGVVATTGVWERYHVPGGKGEWGQNITLAYTHWDTVTRKPKVPFIHGKHESDYLRLTPVEVPSGDALLDDADRAEIEREMAEALRTVQKSLWGSTDDERRAVLFPIFRRAYPGLDLGEVAPRFEKWLKRGGPIWTDR